MMEYYLAKKGMNYGYMQQLDDSRRHYATCNKSVSKSYILGFPGGAVVKNPPANAGVTGSSPGPGRSHMPRSN